MSNNRYTRGRAFEYRVRRFYEMHGWFVIRSAGSKGIADLVAISPQARYIHFIQCKVDGKINTSEREKLVAEAKTYSATPVLAYRKGRELVLVDLRSGTDLRGLVKLRNTL